MTSVGMPSENTSASTCGAPSAYTDAGPPLRIRACGLRARTCAAVTPCPTSSEYTRHSRTRRAISCAYCPPRSTTSTGRSSAGRSGSGRTSAAIVRCLLRDRHVVRMTLAEARGSDADELRTLHLLDRRRAAIAHRLAHAADELVQDRRDGPLVRDTPFDSLRHELLDVLDVALEVTVAGRTPRAHCAERAHAPVLLEPFALMKNDVTGALVGSGQERPGHDGVRAGGNRLRDVARRRHAAVCDQRDTVTRRNRSTVVDRGDLRNPHSGDHPRRTNTAGPHPELHRVCACVDQHLGRLGCRHVPGNDLDVELRLDPPHHLGHGCRMPVRRVDNQPVDTRVDERACALPRIRADTDRGA